MALAILRDLRCTLVVVVAPAGAGHRIEAGYRCPLLLVLPPYYRRCFAFGGVQQRSGLRRILWLLLR